MALKRPIVRYADTGRLEELRSTDTLPSNTTLKGTTLITCTQNADMARAIVLNSFVVNSSVITASIASMATVEHSSDEHLIENFEVRATNIIPGVSFDLVLLAGSVSGISGTWNINWTLDV
jgi:hypothetical protein